MTTITIPTETIKIEKGMVILPLKEYQELCKMVVPTYYLKGKEAKDLDKLVKQGLKEYRGGKTIHANSLKEALKLYESNNKKS